jgi:O-antigen/teichoic acid export membrane protein
MAALIWTSLFYLSSQGVWNLAPVSVTSALTAAPAEAAGFVAVAVILRAPVFVFPAIQAVLLPSVAAAAQHDDRDGTRRALRPPLLLLGVVSIPWLLAATLVVPGLARTVFAAQEVPPWPATTTLAASTLIGAAAFVLQTRALAFRRHRDVGLAWLSGLCVLGLVSAVPGDPRWWGALAQLAAAVVVLMGVLVADSRIGRVHAAGRLSAPSVDGASDVGGSRAEATAGDRRHA